MRAKKSIFIIVSVIIVAVGFLLAYKSISNKGRKDLALKSSGVEQTSVRVDPEKIESATEEATPDTGMMFIGRFPGNVVYDTDKDCYFLELRGARLPFKTSPRQALKVELEAPGKNELEKNRSLLHGMIGPQVLNHITLLVNPDEEDEVMPAVEDLSRYLKIVAPRKFAGLAYTKPVGKLKRSVMRGSQVQSFEEDASPVTPLVLIKGPKSGGSSTRARVLDGGKFVVEGETYKDVWKAADFVCINIVKMLCGSPDCPDAGACATGGDCGCGA